jgi:hypothetical protein
MCELITFIVVVLALFGFFSPDESGETRRTDSRGDTVQTVWRSYYAVLELKDFSMPAEVKHAHRMMSRQWHPGMFSSYVLVIVSQEKTKLKNTSNSRTKCS